MTVPTAPLSADAQAGWAGQSQPPLVNFVVLFFTAASLHLILYYVIEARYNVSRRASRRGGRR